MALTRRRSSPAPPSPPRERPAAEHDEQRYREAGGPQDAATYGCSCGYIFTAPVSTTVACPHCGADQAW